MASEGAHGRRAHLVGHIRRMWAAARGFWAYPLHLLQTTERGSRVFAGTWLTELLRIVAHEKRLREWRSQCPVELLFVHLNSAIGAELFCYERVGRSGTHFHTAAYLVLRATHSRREGTSWWRATSTASSRFRALIYLCQWAPQTSISSPDWLGSLASLSIASHTRCSSRRAAPALAAISERRFCLLRNKFGWAPAAAA